MAVGPAFQPVQVVAPPGDSGKFVGPANEAYVNALVSLQASMDQIATGPPENADGAVSQALSDASQAKLATKNEVIAELMEENVLLKKLDGAL